MSGTRSLTAGSTSRANHATNRVPTPAPTRHNRTTTSKEDRVKIPKPSDADKAHFQALFEGHKTVEVKPMFGNLGAFVNGNMAAGLFGSAVGVRLAADDREALLAQPGAGPFGPEERPMKDYVALPAAWSADAAAAGPWIERAIAHTGGLPPKKPRAKK